MTIERARACREISDDLAKADVEEPLIPDVDIEVGTAVLGTFYRVNVGYASVSLRIRQLVKLHSEIHRILGEDCSA